MNMKRKSGTSLNLNKPSKRIAKDLRSSFFYGAGTVLDVFGTSAPRARIGSLAGDVLSVGKDFAAVGDTIRHETKRQVLHTAHRYGVTIVCGDAKHLKQALRNKNKLKAAKLKVLKQVSQPAGGKVRREPNPADNRRWID